MYFISIEEIKFSICWTKLSRTSSKYVYDRHMLVFRVLFYHCLIIEIANRKHSSSFCLCFFFPEAFQFFFPMLLGLSEIVDRCVPDPPKLVHFWSSSAVLEYPTWMLQLFWRARATQLFPLTNLQKNDSRPAKVSNLLLQEVLQFFFFFGKSCQIAI